MKIFLNILRTSTRARLLLDCSAKPESASVVCPGVFIVAETLVYRTSIGNRARTTKHDTEARSYAAESA